MAFNSFFHARFRRNEYDSSWSDDCWVWQSCKIIHLPFLDKFSACKRKVVFDQNKYVLMGSIGIKNIIINISVLLAKKNIDFICITLIQYAIPLLKSVPCSLIICVLMQYYMHLCYDGYFFLKPNSVMKH